MFYKDRPRAKKSSPTPLWGHRLYSTVTALALSGKGGATKSDKQLLKKHTLKPEIALLNQFPAQKALFKVPKICNINFWIENDPPPLWNFSKNSSDLVAPPFPQRAGWISTHVPID